MVFMRILTPGCESSALTTRPLLHIPFKYNIKTTILKEVQNAKMKVMNTNK